LVLLLEGNTSQIKVRSELKNGRLYTAQEILEFYPDMETWSQIIFDAHLRSVCQPSAQSLQRHL